jgi:hypothetical protein
VSFAYASASVQIVRYVPASGHIGHIGRYDCCQTVATGAVSVACDNQGVASAPKRIRLSEPGVAGSYQLVERRRDGSLVLRPQHERLSDVLRETEGQIFRDEEFAAHLQRVAETDEDLPSDQQS